MITKNKKGQYLTRITPNENKWQKPSGCNGKCSGSIKYPLYENSVDFGWEEWLFNSRNRIGEYQYGFLECFNKQNFDVEVNYEEVYLYTRKCIKDTNEGTTYLVVKINNLKKLSDVEAQEKDDHFNDKIKIMQTEIPNTKNSNLRPTRSNYVLNVKFKIEDAFFISEETEIKISNYRFNIIELDNENKNHVFVLNEIENASFNIKIA